MEIKIEDLGEYKKIIETWKALPETQKLLKYLEKHDQERLKKKTMVQAN